MEIKKIDDYHMISYICILICHVLFKLYIGALYKLYNTTSYDV